MFRKVRLLTLVTVVIFVVFSSIIPAFAGEFDILLGQWKRKAFTRDTPITVLTVTGIEGNTPSGTYYIPLNRHGGEGTIVLTSENAKVEKTKSGAIQVVLDFTTGKFTLTLREDELKGTLFVRVGVFTGRTVDAVFEKVK